MTQTDGQNGYTKVNHQITSEDAHFYAFLTLIVNSMCIIKVPVTLENSLTQEISSLPLQSKFSSRLVS